MAKHCLRKRKTLTSSSEPTQRNPLIAHKLDRISSGEGSRQLETPSDPCSLESKDRKSFTSRVHDVCNKTTKSVHFTNLLPSSFTFAFFFVCLTPFVLRSPQQNLLPCNEGTPATFFSPFFHILHLLCLRVFTYVLPLSSNGLVSHGTQLLPFPLS